MYSTLISTHDLAAHLADPDWIVLDVRHDLTQPERWGEQRYREAHVPGAHFVHLDRDLAAPKTSASGRHPLPTPDACAALFSRLGIDHSKQVVAYDQGGGMFAARTWWMLRWLGHDAAAVLDGGFSKWQREGRPVSTEIPIPRRADFRIRHIGPTLDAPAIVTNLQTSAMTLIDARAPERYRGESEPLDPVAGHIPGALNRPYATNLSPDGTFKPADALRREFAELLGTTPLDRVVHYCGSGVTSAHNILAMEVAGLPGTRLYPGSWSEWCADRARPIARGAEPYASHRSAS